MPPGHARRRVLAVLAGACLAGCSTDSTTPTATRPSTDSGTPTPSPGVVPPSRTFPSTAVAANGHALTAERWFALDAVRYETDDGHATVEPFGDRFVGYEFRLANRSDERRQALPDSEFRLRVAGETHDHVHALRGEVAFRRADQPADEPAIRPLQWYQGLDPDESVSLQLVFDVPAHPEVRHYLAWHHRTAVEGSDEPAYLYP